jgi:hypothetical protein
VYDGDTFAGDARLPDVKAGETRLVSYAIDLTVEASHDPEEETSTPVAVRLRAGKLFDTQRLRERTNYTLRNRGTEPRTVLVTQPIQPGWTLVAPAKPTERTPELYRFEVNVPAGETARLEVIEERTAEAEVALAGIKLPDLVRYEKSAVASPAVRASLARIRGELESHTAAEAAIAGEDKALKAIIEDQGRIRENIERVPKESAAYKRYLQKFDDQETEIEKRRAKVAELQEQTEKGRKALDEYLKTLDVK